MALTSSFPTGLPAGLSITDTRKTLAELVVCNAAGVPRLGVFPRDPAAPIVLATASMAYQVAGADFVTSRTGQGIELVSNDGATTVATTASPSSNSRMDVIWVRAKFTASGDPVGATEFGVTQGVTSGTVPPPKPLIPAGALELATAQIPSTAGATNASGVIITQTYQFTCASGGTLVFRTVAERDTFNASWGQRAYVRSNDAEYIMGASGWIPALGRVFNVKGVPPLNNVAQPAPPAGAVFRIQTHYVEVTTSSGGVATFNWSEAITGGIAHVSFTTLKGSAATPVIDSGTISKTGARVIFPGTGAVVAGFTYQLVYWE